MSILSPLTLFSICTKNNFPRLKKPQEGQIKITMNLKKVYKKIVNISIEKTRSSNLKNESIGCLFKNEVFAHSKEIKPRSSN